MVAVAFCLVSVINEKISYLYLFQQIFPENCNNINFKVEGKSVSISNYFHKYILSGELKYWNDQDLI